MQKWLVITLLPVFLLTGCNTVRGLGEDIMRIGSTIQNSADKARYNRQIRKQQNSQPVYNYNNYNNQYDYYNQELPQPRVYNQY